MDHDKIEKSFKDRPHVVILGAGATIAAIPNGDKNGRKSSVMDGFLDALGMREIIAGAKLDTTSENLEDIYSELNEKPEYDDIRLKLDSRIRSYFTDIEIPDEPNIYDFILLSLRKKDLVATFNWDPLLLQAYQRVCEITKDLPDLAFLHGNVSIGSCNKHKVGGYIWNVCPTCGEWFKPCRLLYPVKQKDYAADSFTEDHWKAIRSYLRRAYLVTIFGYSAPKTDVEAISLMREAWGGADQRSLEDIEIIDIQSEDDLVDTWSDFIHSHHYTVKQSFFESSMAKFPRRTTEELFDRAMNCKFTKPTFSFDESTSWESIKEVIRKLVEEEKKSEEAGQFMCVESA